MPVDNMARYWYARFLETEDPQILGAVLHAIQDASVPHHAAGYTGNWHGRYETVAETKIKSWLKEERFLTNVNSLVAAWTWSDPAPPTRLSRDQYTRRPAINWRIDQLVTWVALNAYREYDSVYNHFRDGYSFVDPSARRLTELATAMTILALKKGAVDLGTGKPPADRTGTLSSPRRTASVRDRDGNRETHVMAVDGMSPICADEAGMNVRKLSRGCG